MGSAASVLGTWCPLAIAMHGRACPLEHTHTHTLSLSLSHSHVHTHTHKFVGLFDQGTTQGRFYALAVAGEMAYYNAERSRQIAGHAAFRKGLLRVLKEGKGIEGEILTLYAFVSSWFLGFCGRSRNSDREDDMNEFALVSVVPRRQAAKVIRNTCANGPASALLWASEPDVIHGAPVVVMMCRHR